MAEAGPSDKPTLRAVLAISSGCLALFSTVGFLNAFGVFQDYYSSHELRGSSPSDISWIGSASIFVLYIGSPLSGILADKFGPRPLVAGGSIGMLVAVFTTSLCHKYYQFFLAQAVLLGFSMAFVTWPLVASVSRHMPNHRGLALGIVIGGSSVGGVVWPIAIEQLLFRRRVGFPWTMRIVGFIMLAILAVALLGSSDPPRPPRTDNVAAEANVPMEKSERPKLFRNPTFQLLCGAYALAYFGLFIPFFYISIYATAHGVTSDLSFYLISIVNGASFFGRVLPGYLADKCGHFNLAGLVMLASGVIAFTWTASTAPAGLIVWSLAYGFTSGAILSLQGACAAKLGTHETQGKAIGGLTGALAVTVLVGSPIGGQLVSKYGFLELSMFTGATLTAGGILLLVARFRVDRRILAVY